MGYTHYWKFINNIGQMQNIDQITADLNTDLFNYLSINRQKMDENEIGNRRSVEPRGG